MVQDETDTISTAISKSKSLRTTTLVRIVRQFRLTEGLKLDWNIGVKHNELVIIVSPVKNIKTTLRRKRINNK